MQVMTVKAQCVYLRGFYQLCHHEILNALDNFFDTLQRLEVSLVPDCRYVHVYVDFLAYTKFVVFQYFSHHVDVNGMLVLQAFEPDTMYIFDVGNGWSMKL